MAFAVNPDINPARLLPGRDFAFFLDGEPVLDLDGHGTHVASTIAQEANNGLYGAGLAYGATILPLKACVGYWELQIIRSALGIPGYHPPDSGGCSTTAIAEAIRYAADNGAKVINLSLGGPTASQIERDAVEYAVGRGALVVAAAGNDFEDGNPVDYPAGFASQFRGLIAVGAVGRGLQRSFYSSTGSHVEVVAPGGDFRAGGPDGGVWQSTLRFADLNPSTVVFPRFDRYEEDAYQGTSMATPHVAGLGALLVAQGIVRPGDLETLITRTARDIGAAGRDDQHGFGLIQPRAALFGLGIRR
jgi:serine protease